MRRFWAIGILCILILFGIVPGCEEVEELPEWIGTWEGSDLVTPGTPVDWTLILNEDETYESLLYDAGTTDLLAGSASRGTYSCSDTLITFYVEEVWNGSAWAPNPLTSSLAYTLSGDTLVISVDFDDDGAVDADWTLTRQ
jgi:hypothetical protein